MMSLFSSASTTASWTHFIAVSKSTISPLRTPRDGAWPTPRILIVPSGFPSPTTTQIFEVPISRPTIKLPLAITAAFLVKTLKWDRLPHREGRRTGVEFFHAGAVGQRLPDGWLHGFCLADFRLRGGRLGSLRRRFRFVGGCRQVRRRLEFRDDGRVGPGKSDRDIARDEQVDGRDFAMRIVAVDEEL